MRVIYASLLALSLTGCASTTGSLTPAQQEDVACQAIGGSIKGLTPLKHSLPATTQTIVTEVAHRAQPICGAPVPPPLSASALDLLLQDAASISGISRVVVGGQ